MLAGWKENVRFQKQKSFRVCVDHSCKKIATLKLISFFLCKNLNKNLKNKPKVTLIKCRL